MKKSIKNLGNKEVKNTKSLKGGNNTVPRITTIQVDLGELAEIELD